MDGSDLAGAVVCENTRAHATTGASNGGVAPVTGRAARTSAAVRESIFNTLRHWPIGHRTGAHRGAARVRIDHPGRLRTPDMAANTGAEHHRTRQGEVNPHYRRWRLARPTAGRLADGPRRRCSVLGQFGDGDQSQDPGTVQLIGRTNRKTTRPLVRSGIGPQGDGLSRPGLVRSVGLDGPGPPVGVDLDYQCMITLSNDETVPGSGAGQAVRGRCVALGEVRRGADGADAGAAARPQLLADVAGAGRFEAGRIRQRAPGAGAARPGPGRGQRGTTGTGCGRSGPTTTKM